MQLHQLQGHGHKKAQRIARGGKRGTTSGRGQKGQKSRSGRRIRPASRDLLIRIPKLRGFRNKSIAQKPLVFDLDTISAKLHPLSGKGILRVDADVLKEVGLVPVRYQGDIKVLSGGDIAFGIQLIGIAASALAKEKIEKAGGKIGS